jgi:hypothetical protein
VPNIEMVPNAETVPGSNQSQSLNSMIMHYVMVKQDLKKFSGHKKGVKKIFRTNISLVKV